MSDDLCFLPIRPPSPSLRSQIFSLDVLAAQLSSLKRSVAWDTATSASFGAQNKESLAATGNIKINVGGEWWVDMTPSEGLAWIKRRKAEEHTQILETLKHDVQTTSLAHQYVEAGKASLPLESATLSSVEQETRAEASVTRPKKPVAVQATVSESGPANLAPTAATKSKIQETFNKSPGGKGKSKETIPKITSGTPSSTSSNVSTATTSKADNPEAKTLAAALSQFMETQNALAQATGGSAMPTGNPTDAMINEEGLPIHEIREDENGKLINDLPAVVGDVEIKEVEEKIEEKDDFWSKEAVARREALRRKVFDDPSDSEDDSEIDSYPSQEAVQSPIITATPPTPSTQTTPVPEPSRRTSSSSSSLQPKSILKSSAPRKKSVSFDSSVPAPPDSPGITKIGGSTFPNPVINIETGIEERAVPILNAPKRSPNKSTFGEPFAGFKAGFLGASKGKVNPPSPVTLSEEPAGVEEPKQQPTPVPKKQSLFAQRQSDPSPELTTEETKPSFPAMSTSTHTSSVKNEIIERPSPTPASTTGASAYASAKAGPSRDRVTGKTAGVAATVTERSDPVAGPSRLTSHLPPKSQEGGEDEYDEEEDDDDDDSFYADDDDDEYDLDDALLAREVALAYHQNRAYSQLGQQRANSQRRSDDNPDGFDESYVDGYGDDASEEEGEGGVMLGIPQIMLPNGKGGMPSIINPTPDDLRKFVRVGKLDNGKLVLAPGEDGWSDEEKDVMQEKNREEIKAALLGRGGPSVPKVQEKRTGDEGIGMPPAVESAGRSAPLQSAVKETNVSVPAVQQAPIDPPKKVSRFKAARMG